MFTHRVKILTLAGFDIYIDLSWIFLALLISWSLATGYFPFSFPDLTPTIYWSMGIAGAFGLFISIILHELSHSLVARQFGLAIRGITLFIFGGVAEMADEPPHPRAEFLVAIAGPIASLFLGGVFYLLAGISLQLGVPAHVAGVASYLALINTLLAIFNMIPAFPLDGGRVLRSWLWHRSGDLGQATEKAAKTGSFLGAVLIGFGLLNLITGNVIGGVWLGLIGLFIRGAAGSTIYQARARGALSGRMVRDFMTANPITVSADVTLAELIEEYIYRHHHSLFPVIDNGTLVGLIGAKTVAKTPRDQWQSVLVGNAMLPCGENNTIDADEDAMKAMLKMSRTGESRLLVLEDGNLVGLLSLKDIVDLLSLKMTLEN